MTPTLADLFPHPGEPPACHCCDSPGVPLVVYAVREADPAYADGLRWRPLCRICAGTMLSVYDAHRHGAHRDKPVEVMKVVAFAANQILAALAARPEEPA